VENQQLHEHIRLSSHRFCNFQGFQNHIIRWLYFLISVQILDGIAGEIFGVFSVLMIADLTRRTGQFNIIQGMLNTAIGIGAELSNFLYVFVLINIKVVSRGASNKSVSVRAAQTLSSV
jgi:hypothetical protein